tara:strand:- start:3619 stop:4074 length:456 start_codon:yes stop_codon:yes gene_type:complete
MARYASGSKAYGISDRSGFRYKLSEMLTEWNGAKVGPDEFEAKHPQLEPISPGPDPQALFDPRPDTSNKIPVKVTFPIFNTETLEFTEPVFMRGSVGTVTLGGAVVTPAQVVGVSSTAALASVTIAGSTSISTFDSTNVTLDSTTRTFDEG